MAIEVIVVALLGSISVSWFALTGFATQRHSFAAMQLARQAVRMEVLYSSSDAELAFYSATMAESLKLPTDEVTVSVAVTGDVAKAEASVAGAGATAVMRVSGGN